MTDAELAEMRRVIKARVQSVLDALAAYDRGEVADDRCPSDPVGDGTHWFAANNLCRYCCKLDPLRADD